MLITSEDPRVLSTVELNAIKYTAGYVIRKLMQKYASCEAITKCLREMVEGGEADVPSSDAEFHCLTSIYQSKVNRGGLISVSHSVLKFFCLIEHHGFTHAKALLGQHLRTN